jgi:hypothetical protein
MAVPIDDGRKRRHAILIDGEDAPIAVGRGVPMTRAAATATLRRAFNEGRIRTPVVRLVDYDEIEGKPGQVRPREIGSIDLHPPMIGSDEFRASVAPLLEIAIGTPRTFRTDPPDDGKPPDGGEAA